MTESLVTFGYELANFVLFAGLLAWLFFKPVRKFLDEQSQRHAAVEQQTRENLDASEDLRQQLARQRSQWIREAEQQRTAMLKETRHEAQRMLDDAKRQIAEQHEQLRREAIKIQQGQAAAMADTVAMAASRAVSSLLKQIDGPSLESALVESACRQLQASSHDHEESIIVELATRPSDEMQERITQSAGAVSPEASLQYRIADELIGGIRIRTSSGMIDHSIAGLADFVQQTLQRELNHHA